MENQAGNGQAVVPLEPRFCPLCGGALRRYSAAESAARYLGSQRADLFPVAVVHAPVTYECEPCRMQFVAGENGDPGECQVFILTGARLPA